VPLEEIIPSDSEVLLFVDIGIRTYFFKTTGRLPLSKDDFRQLGPATLKIDELASDRVSREPNNALALSDGGIDRLWGVLNFATLLVFHEEISSFIEMELSDFGDNAFSSFVLSKGN
jgi:hypothetical protein